MFKMGLHDPLEVMAEIRVKMCRLHATYLWKALDKGYNFSFNLTSIKGLHKKLWASKVVGVLILKILGFPTWESREK
jgi:hypothetical protein